MAYKISDKAILVESGGENILIAETATYERGGLTILDSDYTLSPSFVSSYFSDFSKAYFSLSLVFLHNL